MKPTKKYNKDLLKIMEYQFNHLSGTPNKNMIRLWGKLKKEEELNYIG